MNILIKISTVLFLFATIGIHSQSKKITEILNKKFQLEQKMYEDDETKPELLEPFRIQDGILSFTFKSVNPYSGKLLKVKREVPLEKITDLIKDINVIMMTDGDEVTQTTIEIDEKGTESEPNIHHTYMFFTELNKEKYNEDLQKSLLKAFKKAGHEIKSEDWYD